VFVASGVVLFLGAGKIKEKADAVLAMG